MKKITALIMLLCLVCLVGCSKNDPTKDITVKWENGITKINNKEVYFSEYKPGGASIKNGMLGLDWEITIDYAKDVTTLTYNTQSILEENMDKFKGKFYYTEWSGTQFTMAASIGEDTWSVCKTRGDGIDSTVAAAYASDYIDKIPITGAQVYVDFGSFIFGDEYSEVIVRPDCALISSVIKVSQDVHSGSEPYTIIQDDVEYTLMKETGKKYDYYTYDGYTIQCVAGMAPDSYIKFKK